MSRRVPFRRFVGYAADASESFRTVSLGTSVNRGGRYWSARSASKPLCRKPSATCGATLS
jgi:hypothetical protein